MKYMLKTAKKTLIIIFSLLIFGGVYTKCTAQQNMKKDKEIEKVEKFEEKKNVKKLIRVMQDKNMDLSVRHRATSALGRIKDVRAVEPLIVILNDRSSPVRVQATYALGQLKDVRAVQPLIVALNDNDVRKSSAEALGRIGDADAIKPLIVVLTDTSSLGREEAAMALDSLGWKPSNDSEKAYYLVAKRDWDNCVELDNLAIEPLVFTLNDGHDNARIGAIETLDRLGWKPEEDNVEAYNAANALKLEMIAIRETIVQGEMKLKKEFEVNLQKLIEYQKAGDSTLTEEDFRYLEKRFTQDINKEQQEIEAFRAELNQVNLKITRFGDRRYIGMENGGDGVMTFRVIRTQNGMIVTGGIWYNSWTGKPIKEFEWDKLIGNFYRFNSKGEKYIYAKYYFFEYREQLQRIDFVEPDGSLRERIKWGGPNMIWGYGSKMSTRIGEDKWIEWPNKIGLANERLNFIEAKLITNKNSHLR